MASTIDSSEQSNHVDDHEKNAISSTTGMTSDGVHSGEKIEEPASVSESEETDNTSSTIIHEVSETDRTDQNNTSMNMVTAEATFTEAASADLPLGTPRSSVARILVKPGQIFRVQVDHEVKEVHGK